MHLIITISYTKTSVEPIYIDMIFEVRRKIIRLVNYEWEEGILRIFIGIYGTLKF